MLTVVNISIVVFLLALFAWLSRDMIGGAVSKVTPASASDLRGEWVGILDVAPARHSTWPGVPHQAAIRFNLGVTDSFLSKYGGSGEITFAGAKPQGLEVRDLKLVSNSGDGSYKAGIWLDSFTADQARTDPLSGGFRGFFEPGTLTLSRDDVDDHLGLIMSGTLKKGSDADYQRLAQQLKAN